MLASRENHHQRKIHWLTVYQVIRKGYMLLHNNSISILTAPRFWFVLTSDNLSWYKDDDEEKEKKFMLQLDGVKLKDLEEGFLAIHRRLKLFYPDGKPICKDFKQLELSAKNGEVDAWKASFLRAGVYHEKYNSHADENSKVEEVSSLDQRHTHQVETIRNLVESYMRIVTKTIRDLVPKAIMNLIVNKISDFLRDELLANLYQQGGNTDDLMEESPIEAQKREGILRMNHSRKEALRIIDDATMATVAVNLPMTAHISQSTDRRNNPSPVNKPA